MAPKVKFIMRTVGDADLSEYLQAIPNLMICEDTKHEAKDTYRMSLEMAGDDACVNMEDDIILCDHFYDRAMNEISKRPNDVIQFFSMRGDDLKIGSRYIPGYQYLMNQCFYLPMGMARAILEYMPYWLKENEGIVGGTDSLTRDFFKLAKIKYWNVVPNLVDHKQVKSRIDPRRSTKRQSFTFQK